MMRTFIPVFPAVLALYWPFCTPELRPSQPPERMQIEELWERPADCANDAFHAGGHERQAATRYITRLLAKIEEGRNLRTEGAGG